MGKKGKKPEAVGWAGGAEAICEACWRAGLHPTTSSGRI